MSDQSYYDLSGWAQIPCNVSEWMIQRGEDLKPYSSLTDLAGEFGEPLVYTEWGTKEGDEQPVLRNYRWPDSDRPCEHWVNKLQKTGKEFSRAMIQETCTQEVGQIG